MRRCASVEEDDIDAAIAALAETGVQCARDDAVVTLTIDRVERRNSQTPAMWRALAALGRALPGDVRVLVIRGAGPSFSAGLDKAMFTPEGLPGELPVFELASRPAAAIDEVVAGYQEAFTWWERADLFSIAGVQGHAVGGGFQLALGCDFRVVTDDAQFTMAEVSRGIVPDLGGTARLLDLVGPARALDICVTGRRVGAEEALRVGLADRVCALADLDAAVATLVGELLAAPRDAAVAAKALVQQRVLGPAGAQRRAEREAQARRLRDLAGVGE